MTTKILGRLRQDLTQANDGGQQRQTGDSQTSRVIIIIIIMLMSCLASVLFVLSDSLLYDTLPTIHGLYNIPSSYHCLLQQEFIR